MQNKYAIDASYVLSFLLPDETTEMGSEVFIKYKSGEIILISSPILKHEVANGLKSAYLSKRLKLVEVKKYLEIFEKLNIVTIDIDLQETIDISVKEKISFYDATYIYVAKQEKIQLLTLDKKLQKV